MDELEALYEELPNKSERLELIGVIGAPGVSFDDDAESDGGLDFEEPDDDPRET